MPKRSLKGSAFERQFVKELSVWWCGEDDCFWRTAGSGGRATVRGQKGKRTAGAYGDIAATDDRGEPLLSFLVMELKRGYNKHTIQDVLDRSDNAAEQTYEKWIQQAVRSQELSGAFSWAIVFRRDRRNTMILMPTLAWSALKRVGAFREQPLPYLQMEAWVGDIRQSMMMMTVSGFFKCVSPEMICDVVGKTR